MARRFSSFNSPVSLKENRATLKMINSWRFKVVYTLIAIYTICKLNTFFATFQSHRKQFKLQIRIESALLSHSLLFPVVFVVILAGLIIGVSFIFGREYSNITAMQIYIYEDILQGMQTSQPYEDHVSQREVIFESRLLIFQYYFISLYFSKTHESFFEI